MERERMRGIRVLLSSPCYEMLMAAVWEKSCCLIESELSQWLEKGETEEFDLVRHLGAKNTLLKDENQL